ncbi:MAG: CDGSH iron-sulfur domain-containing protein [Cocleimonas sp.]|nr:CDGSH iron-sulfur domain-containing protein [Cocleimonas sp.]
MPHRSNPVIAKKAPYVVELEAGKTYYWCSCGRSESQPFCDGSHKGTIFEPVKVEVEETKKVGLCGCKHTKAAPFCDREHSKL